MSDLPNLAAALTSLGRSAAGVPRLVAIGWATVDAERLITELPGVTFSAADSEPSLGAQAWVGHTGAVDLVLLEPLTEGRLAAALARRGEGLAVLYVEASSPLAAGGPTAVGRPGRLLPHGRPWGPFLIEVSCPGT